MLSIQFILILAALVYLFYKWATLKYETFKDRGIPYEKPLPLVGNFLSVVLNRESMPKAILRAYQNNKQHKIFGFFNFRDPIFVINDLEAIKKVTVKDFNHFPNHYPFFPTDNDPLLDGMLSIMKDQRWKNMRNTLTPIFTSAKMRSMFSLMSECFDESLIYLREQVQQANGQKEMNIKDSFNRLSNDIIASTAFGLKVNSFDNEKNEFFTIGQAVTKFRGSQMIKLMLLSVLPKLAQLINLNIFDKEKSDYFKRLVLDAMKYRQEHNIVRPDMINLLMETRKETSSQHWTDDEIVAQCFIFFFAAFENNSNLICSTCHELLDNPDVQQKLYEECLQVKQQLNGSQLDYDDINKMKYMDMVISETLRKWALASVTDRICSEDYTLTDEDDNIVFEFKQGDRIWLPLVGLQWDERYFSQPSKFDPERFSEENKGNIHPFAYIPFGVGPRVCIGNRYALMQAKAMLYFLVLEFEFKRSPKTLHNFMDEQRGFQSSPFGGYWMNLVKRQELN